MIGQSILNYRIEQLLGEGGMGTVYLGVHTQLGRKVAIKVLNPSLAADPHIRERFKNEAATMANLQHPNIVTLYDYLEQADGLFLIMEYIEGVELDRYIKTITGPIPETKATELFGQILDAFAYAHRKGVIHRDIKPSNIMISNEGVVKILDFGIAKLVGNDNNGPQRHHLTRTGMRMGTVLYMSPEQVRGQQIDHRSDIYSLGIVLFEMLTARVPYNQEESEFDINLKIVSEPLPRAKEFYPGVSDRMQALIDKATAKKPEQRFQQIEDFKAALSLPAAINGAQAIGAQTQANGGQQPLPPVKQQPEINRQETKNIAPKHPAPGSRKNPWNRVFWLLFVLAFIGLGLVVAGKKGWIGKAGKLFGKDREYTAIELKERVNQYYRALETHQFKNVKEFYAPQLTRYFGRKNVDIDFVRQSTEEYWENTPEDEHKLIWSSFSSSQEGSGNYLISITMNYKYKRLNEEWKEHRGRAVIRFDQDLKIIYIAPN